jgi:hypothetical protein
MPETARQGSEVEMPKPEASAEAAEAVEQPADDLSVLRDEAVGQARRNAEALRTVRLSIDVEPVSVFRPLPRPRGHSRHQQPNGQVGGGVSERRGGHEEPA